MVQQTPFVLSGPLGCAIFSQIQVTAELRGARLADPAQRRRGAGIPCRPEAKERKPPVTEIRVCAPRGSIRDDRDTRRSGARKRRSASIQRWNVRRVVRFSRDSLIAALRRARSSVGRLAHLVADSRLIPRLLLYARAASWPLIPLITTRFRRRVSGMQRRANARRFVKALVSREQEAQA